MTTAEAHIYFNRRVVYQSHFPTEPSDFVRVELVFPDLDASEPLRRERQVSPPGNLVPRFTVSFPDQETDQTKSLAVQFVEPVSFQVRGNKAGNAIIISVPVHLTVSEDPPTPRTPTQDVKRSAEDLMILGRDAFNAGLTRKAIRVYEVLLAIPANQHSQEAQELIGQAYEQIGELDKARAAYQRYLELYSVGAGVRRVRSRFAVILSGERPPRQKTVQKSRESQPGGNISLLDRIDVVQTPSGADIQFDFNTTVEYITHSPAERSQEFQVVFATPDLTAAETFLPEPRTLPESDLTPGFSVTFSEPKGKKTKRLVIRFDQPVQLTVRKVRSRRSLIVSIPGDSSRMRSGAPTSSLPGPPVGGDPLMPAPSIELGQDVVGMAEDLMAQGREAMNKKEYKKATQIFNAVLNLPPHQHSQEAQELVGLARERRGQFEAAQLEYELYLALYPEREGAARVQQRLAALPGHAPPEPPSTGFGAKKRTPHQRTSVFGSLSQYYFSGMTQSRTTTTSAGLQTTTAQQNTHDQSLLVSTLDLTARSRTGRYDNRLVVRGANTLDMLAERDKDFENRLRSAYITLQDTEQHHLVQVGRQPGVSGGILTPFDGGWVRYGVFRHLGLNVVGGFPQRNSFNSDIEVDTDHYFYGGRVDLGPLAEQWNVDAYVINQMVDGVVDRRATGTELRYFSGGLNAFSLIDYDVSYNVLNIAMLNGSWRTEMGSTFTLLLDHRKTPSMQTLNALFSTGTDSVQDALRQVSEDELRRQAQAVTAEADLLVLSLTHPVTTTWQLGGDVSVTRTSATEAAGTQPALPGSGTIWTYSGRAIGNRVVFDDHTVTMSASYIDSPNFQGQSLTVNSLARLWEHWQLNTTVRVFHQRDTNHTRLVRVTPTLRLGYQWGSMSLEVEGGIEKGNTTSQNLRDSSLREFFFIGYFWQR